ncbi:25176_t:CDS:2 [Cetraspora pellucida]|uniref:25176_t:CDS:1 n=1 Tax=Cetraspora pellucida TaxID=1433469 RepID=A0A9N9DZ29_9GLOM|nr:25176_t:CDS:2 [Cetraspora pellucida]
MGQTLSSDESVNKSMGQTQSSSELAEEKYQRYRKLAHDEAQRRRPITEIDLHGLYVKEAMDKTESRIQHCKANKIDHLVIIVGRGKHSSGLAKLKPAIINLMKKYQLRCTPDKPTVGCLYVEFGLPGEPINIGWFDNITNCIIC